jgi:large subunit ribosomal protein L30
MNEEKRIAVVRIRGGINVRGTIKDTMSMLKLYRQNYCVVVNGSASTKGMIDKIKDYVAWGEIDDETFKLLTEKRGKEKKFFRLNPPRGGFGRKGIKIPFKVGGALGYRGNKINDLIKRMV